MKLIRGVDYLSGDDISPFIPASNHRKNLQKRGACIFSVVACCIVVILVGLLIFGIFPRPIRVTYDASDILRLPRSLSLEKFDVPPNKYRLNVSFNEPIHVRNENYYSITVHRVQMDANFVQTQSAGSSYVLNLGKYDRSLEDGRTVLARSTKVLNTNFEITFDTRPEDPVINLYSEYFTLQFLSETDDDRFVDLQLNSTIYYRLPFGFDYRETQFYSIRLSTRSHYKRIIEQISGRQ